MTINQTMERYITQKTRDLKEFGYTSLTEDTVRKEAEKVTNGDKDLSVIGMIIKKDLQEAGLLEAE